jgi:hypothetical protein
MSPSLIVHKNRDSLFWKIGEPLFNTVRDLFTKSAEMAREDLESRESEANQKGPIQKMEEKLDRMVNQPRRKYKTQTEIQPVNIFNSVPVLGALTKFS